MVEWHQTTIGVYMPIPDYQTFMLPVLRAGADGEVKTAQVARQVAEVFKLTEEERNQLLPSGKQRIIDNRVHWSRTFLAKAGLVEATKRGHYRATELGKKVLSQGLERIDNKFLEQFPGFAEFRHGSIQEKIDTATLATEEAEKTPDEIMRAAFRQVEAALRDELLTRILSGSPSLFEQIVVRLLLAMGYGGSIEDAGKVLGKSGDNGVDGVIDQDALGLDRVYVQAKRYKLGNNVGPGEIRDFFGSLDHFKASKGLFVTTSGFSSAARDTAERLSKRIVLIDGEQLAHLMMRHNVGCRIEETLHLKKIDEDVFLE